MRPSAALCLCVLASLWLRAQQEAGTSAPRAVAVQAGGRIAPVREARIALVIGNGTYPAAPLRNPPNDARALAATLQGCGFQVQTLVDATLPEMEAGLRQFGQRLKAGGVGLFYYAGHGMQVKGINYLIPVGAAIAEEDEVRFTALDANEVLAKMESAGNGLNLVILDACRNDPFGRSWSRGGASGLAQMDAPSGTYIAFATAPGKTASDGSGEHGLYTQKLLDALDQPGLNVEQVFKRVRVGVKLASKDQQVPWDSSSLTGEFFFRPGPATGEQGPAQAAAPGPQRTVGYWMAYQSEMDAAMEQLKAVLAGRDLNPGGKLAALAEAETRWSEDNPYSDKARQDRAWIRDQKVRIRIAQSTAVAAQASRTLTADGFAAWRVEERANLADALRGVPKGEKYLQWLEKGQSPSPGEGARAGEVMAEEASGLTFVWVPAGTFTMGSGKGNKDERPEHPVTLTRGFWMAQCKVTQAQFQAVTGSNPSYFKGAGPTAPVENVEWDQCQTFINKLNLAQSEWTFALPTEAEWEYACRAGSADERYGDLDAIAWHAGNSGGIPHPVGQKQANAWGLYDMLGNVWELCQDWYGGYDPGTCADPQGPSSGNHRVLRGGSWCCKPVFCRAAYRDWWHAPVLQIGSIGFRVKAVARGL